MLKDTWVVIDKRYRCIYSKDKVYVKHRECKKKAWCKKEFQRGSSNIFQSLNAFFPGYTIRNSLFFFLGTKNHWLLQSCLHSSFYYRNADQGIILCHFPQKPSRPFYWKNKKRSAKIKFTVKNCSVSAI